MSRAVDGVLQRLRLRRQPRLQRTRQEVAKSIPVRNKLVEWRTEETGEVSLIIPVDQKRHLRFLIRLMDLPDKRVVALDEVGSFVWGRCDGTATFEDIAVELGSSFGMTRREAEASLSEFFRILGKRGMLGFLVAAGAKASNETGR